MADDTVRKMFGARKLVGADAGIVSTLTMLGPWGVALIAAYLAGQGLAKLAEKIQAMRGPTAPAIPLTSEEEAQIRDAIQIIEAERFAQMHPEIIERIEQDIAERGSDYARTVAQEGKKLIELVDSPLPPSCQELRNLLVIIREQFQYDHIMTWGEQFELRVIEKSLTWALERFCSTPGKKWANGQLE